MEKKFESELGKRIVEGKKRQSTINMGVIAAAVVSFALLVGSAVFLLPAMAGAETGKPVMTEVVPILGQDDYLVYVAESDEIVHTDSVATDEKYDLKRLVTLKEMTYESPSAPYDKDYNMFVYTVNVVLRDLENVVSPESMVLGTLTIPYTGNALPTTSWSIAVNLVELTGIIPASVATDLENDEISVQAFLPAGISYASGDNIQIKVTIKVLYYAPVPVDGVVEEAFPAFSDLSDLPVAEAGVDQTAYSGDEVTLDGSQSTDVGGIVSYIWTFDCDGTLTSVEGQIVTISFFAEGDYVVTLTVTDGDSLTDIDTVLITVLPAPLPEEPAEDPVVDPIEDPVVDPIVDPIVDPSDVPTETP